MKKKLTVTSSMGLSQNLKISISYTLASLKQTQLFQQSTKPQKSSVSSSFIIVFVPSSKLEPGATSFKSPGAISFRSPVAISFRSPVAISFRSRKRLFCIPSISSWPRLLDFSGGGFC
ncbi:LOW QUALITY PROTEIN: hypothetical protein PanWU01x14_148250 [Parasponia andersonii]|uniref:Uncharacterized protein n=1 Tax=Parasponia andersonii TaxID=3476 RepID=A0A2P5CJ24_PARAD|nr:LOW QUALITY PROTEIN: hypothetical protein PanWU01x14_148250 [Parasponia andersonii]